jgi:hypothetical protein
MAAVQEVLQVQESVDLLLLAMQDLPPETQHQLQDLEEPAAGGGGVG